MSQCHTQRGVLWVCSSLRLGSSVALCVVVWHTMPCSVTAFLLQVILCKWDAYPVVYWKVQFITHWVSNSYNQGKHIVWAFIAGSTSWPQGLGGSWELQLFSDASNFWSHLRVLSSMVKAGIVLEKDAISSTWHQWKEKLSAVESLDFLHLTTWLFFFSPESRLQLIFFLATPKKFYCWFTSYFFRGMFLLYPFHDFG